MKIQVTELYQNIPNPFRYETTISSDMENSDNMTLEFFDVTGKVLKRINKYFDKGLNSVKVEFDDDINGVIYYRMTTGEFTKTLKMLKIK
ncbi:MAG: T9SS type A sorting domain-containing protein [Saprospiraceae bacterium]